MGGISWFKPYNTVYGLNHLVQSVNGAETMFVFVASIEYCCSNRAAKNYEFSKHCGIT